MNYGQENSIPMSSSDGTGVYSGTISGSDAAPGSMVRWAVRATDASGNSVREPKFSNGEDRQYYGTVVRDTSFQASLPVVEL